MRIAVLADVHGNVRALQAVLADIDQDRVEMIVVAGDVAGGPFGHEALELLRARPERMHWIRGNAERSAVAAFDGVSMSDDPPGRVAIWAASALDRQLRDELASWPIAIAVDGVLFCHGSPRSEDEIITAATPEAVLSDMLLGVEERLVVGGHTHQQFVRRLPSGQVWANAGSVGLSFEGRTGAFWMTIEARVAEPRARPHTTSRRRSKRSAARASRMPTANAEYRWLIRSIAIG